MTIKLTINGSPVSPTDEPEINQQINRRRNDGARICVNAAIKAEGIDVGLVTRGCGNGGGGRRPNEREQRVIDLWLKLGLSEDEFSGGQVIAFLRQVQRLA